MTNPTGYFASKEINIYQLTGKYIYGKDNEGKFWRAKLADVENTLEEITEEELNGK